MNAKGSIAVSAAVVILVAAVIGIFIVDEVSEPTWDNEAVVNSWPNGTAFNVTENISYTIGPSVSGYDCKDPDNPTVSAYDWTHGGGLAANQFNVTTFRTSAAVMFNTLTDNEANVSMNFTAVKCDQYITDRTSRIILEYFAIIMGVAALALGGAWLYWKGGL